MSFETKNKYVYFLMGVVAGIAFTALLALPSLSKNRGAVYELPIIKDEKGLKVPRGVYRVTTYNGKAYLMIELPKGEGE